MQLNDLKRTWVEIDLTALEKNINAVKSHTNKDIIAVVKADAYGHGVEIIVKKLLEFGVKYFAVSNINEALELREFTDLPVLILGYTDAKYADILAENKITQTILSYDYAISLKPKSVLNCHIAVDTGMGRVGLRYDDAEIFEKIEKIKKLSNINFTHLFTHFAGADMVTSYTEKQYERIIAISNSVNLPFHCQNSAASVNTNLKGEFVRLGISMYGIKPDEGMLLPYELTPVMTFKSVIGHIQTLKKGEFVSYGMTYQAQEDIKIAVICAGYADGYPRVLSNKGYVYINGKTSPIIGRVCMDMFMVNVTDIDVKVGDEIELFGKNILVNKVAKIAGTIGYEIVCGISKRVCRVPDGTVNR